MLLHYVRHGDPTYDPDQLTPLGRRQAEAVAKRLSLYGVDKIFSSSSTRAMQTSDPTCEILKKEKQILDFANEHHAWCDFSVVDKNGKRNWAWWSQETRHLFLCEEVLALGHKWYEHPAFKDYRFKEGMERVYNALDEFLLSLGYKHQRYTGRYEVVAPNDERVALFAHQGFGLIFLSCLLDIPLPIITMHFDMTYTGMTSIVFVNENGICYPRILTLSNDSHIFREGLPTEYNHSIHF